MANFPEEAQPQSPITGSESLLAAKPAASGAIMIYITPAQLKEYIGTGVPANFFDIGNKVNVAFMPRVGISEIDHEQPVVNGVIGDIQIRRAWLRQFIMDLGAELGWGTGTPSTPLGAAAISLGNITENSIGFSWQAVANAASYDIYRGGVKIANVSTTNFNSTGLTASTSYQHYVRPVPASGSNYTTGPASNTLAASTTVTTGLPTPTAPTITFNAGTRMLSATHPNYANGLEKRYNGGAWENWADSATVYVGTDAVLDNAFEWRVKAISGTNLAGVLAGNTAIPAKSTGVAYTRITAPTAPVVGLTFSASDSKTIATQFLQNIVQRHNECFTTGVKDVSYRAQFGGIGIMFEEKGKGYENQPYLTYSLNNVNGKLEGFIKNIDSSLVAQDYFPTEPFLFGFDYRVATKDLLFVYSTDGGATFTKGDNGKPIPLPDGITLFLRINKDAIESGMYISEQVQYGMTIGNAIS
jgi:hypothetical protein